MIRDPPPPIVVEEIAGWLHLGSERVGRPSNPWRSAGRV